MRISFLDYLACPMRARLWVRRTVAALLLISAGVIIGSWPVTTRYGVNYQWSSKQIPLYEKAINFLRNPGQF
jgi:hypothetical protein